MSDNLNNKKNSTALMWASFLDEAEAQPRVMPTLTDVHAARLTCLRCGEHDFVTPGCKGWGTR